jgi:hypothetical protein
LLKQNHDIKILKLNRFRQELSELTLIEPEKYYLKIGIILSFVGFILACIGAIFIFSKINIAAIIFFCLGGLVSIVGIVLLLTAKQIQNKHLTDRRKQLREFTVSKNHNIFHSDGNHWSVSPRASYLILRLKPLEDSEYNSILTIDYPVE